MPGVLFDLGVSSTLPLDRTSLRPPCQNTDHQMQECFEATRSGNVTHVQHFLRSETQARGQNVINKPDAAFTVAQKYLPCAFLLSIETIDVDVKDNS